MYVCVLLLCVCLRLTVHMCMCVFLHLVPNYAPNRAIKLSPLMHRRRPSNCPPWYTKHKLRPSAPPPPKCNRPMEWNLSLSLSIVGTVDAEFRDQTAALDMKLATFTETVDLFSPPTPTADFWQWSSQTFPVTAAQNWRDYFVQIRH